MAALSLWVAVEDRPEMVAEGPSETATTFAAEGDPSRLSPLLGNLLAGTVSLDLASFRRAADEFFARLEDLAQNLAASPAAVRLSQWLLVAVSAAGAFEYARRRINMPRASWSPHAEKEGPSWAPFPVLAVLPPEDEL